MREYYRIVEDLGGEVVGQTKTGKHWKLKIRTPGGNVYAHGVSTTPSDSQRGIKNWKSEVRRNMRRLDNGEKL